MKTPIRQSILNKKVDHYGSQYSNFATELYKQVRLETFGIDMGQNGWITVDEQNLFIQWLKLDDKSSVLDIACGSGGPTLRLAENTGCSVTGIDIHEDGIKTAKSQAKSAGLTDLANFIVADAGNKLPFKDETFDAVICIDAINHLPKRPAVLKEWHRVLKPEGKLLFTDPIVVTGILTKEDIETRASIGYFLFAADGMDEKLLEETGFEVIYKVDRTDNMVKVARRWKNARQLRSEELIRAEGNNNFEGQQAFFEKCAELGEHKHLSRIAFLATKKYKIAYRGISEIRKEPG